MSKAVAPLVIGSFVNYTGLWNDFLTKWQKSYSAAEESERFNVFVGNVIAISEENAKGYSHQLGITQFADLTTEEFSNKYLGFKPELSRRGLGGVPYVSPNITVAESVDWVSKGAVTPVKDQAHCGSCWSFSATGSMEGALYVATQKLVSLSEEELVQCDMADSGCKGGAMDNAFAWVQKNGICTESSYPYTSGGQGVRGSCQRGCSAVLTLSGFSDVPSGDENELMKAVTQQPVSVAIEADKQPFQLYTGGVLDSPGCGTNLDHGVLAVGYGTEDGKMYWKVKNSWGASWGENGYIRIARGKNMCGIAQMASYPTGAKALSPSDGPTPAPAPPSPVPPSPTGSHYSDPKSGCLDDEAALSLQGASGSVCAPKCDFFSGCPQDVPEGVIAVPSCALEDANSHQEYCALQCIPGIDGQCGSGSCKSVGGFGVCLYDQPAGYVLDMFTPVRSVATISKMTKESDTLAKEIIKEIVV